MSTAAPLQALAAKPRPLSNSTHAGLLLQRKCACGAPTASLTGECAECKSGKRLQTNLVIGASNDPLEQEADRVADQVLAAQANPAVSHAAPKIQRDSQAADAATQDAPASVDRALASSGRPLDAPLRHDMEQRFGHDFSRVRIHADSAAEQSAREIKANAYTVGRDIAFGAGQFAPETQEGRRLIAHELTHVVQQSGSNGRQCSSIALIQRQPKKDDAPAQPTAKTDVSIVLSDDEQDMAEGRAYAKTVLRVTDAADAAAKLKALGVPIGQLFVVSHSSAAGQVEFISSIGTISWVPINDLAKALKGAATIDEVDFRGCKMGNAPSAMESFRQTVGAQSTRGSNCWTFIQRATPLTLDGVAVTSPSQIPKGAQAAFDKALLNQLAGMVAENNQSVQNCLLGLAKGEKANAKTLAKIWKLYWANNGNLVASWGSPDFNKNWQEGSICTKDMTANTTPCAIVETKAPPAAAPAAGAKTSALEDVHPGIEIGDATRAQDSPRPEELA